mmetsp:Transcript_7270/g.18942  ORF Transcript_7270/g.18942 Transcript_7270/m.18942 type:complete len:259 (+) Transcript_7270:59-835(+)|eukprot:CAMPEP_0197421562 /NCGR_PEP_ID=MMETSP1170-20131217/9004_1 /TAXON_ID=54406 /ORGANISM="Sarcinochrysis sp, Strain CCMP770" /LENGTH=258 /DNA_ID=CAMNT_0042948813 /DNA_START=59 /DNA_END=835 /DNA_ORIENTATION=+
MSRALVSLMLIIPGCRAMGYFEADAEEALSLGSILFENASTYEGQVGSLMMTETDDGLHLLGSFVGNKSTEAHWHIFSGSCDAIEDYWTHFDTSFDENGFMDVNLTLDGISLHDPDMPLEGVEMIYGGEQVACGGVYDVIGVDMTVGDVKGVLISIAHCDPCHIHLNGALGKLEPGATGMIKIHEGESCDDAGDSYSYTSLFDPWANVTFVADDDGNAQIDAGMEVFTNAGQYPIQGKAVATWDGDDRTGCGVLTMQY